MPTKTRPRIGFVIFESYHPKMSVTTLLGDGTATPTGGFGGWSIKSRPKRKGMTRWDGGEPMSIDIPILIDYFVEQRGDLGERDCKTLEKMAGGLDDDEPPLIQFDAGGAIPHDRYDNPGVDWVIEDIQWGDCIRSVNGNRQRQAAVVTVRQFIDDDRLLTAAQKRRKKKKKPKHPKGPHGSHVKVYTVKKSDLKRGLPGIAAKLLGKASRWHEIAKLNGIRDPKKIKVGQKLRIP